MKTLGLLLFLTVAGGAQVVPDCSNCTNADWGREWHPQHENCTYNPLSGCGYGCNCQMAFAMSPPDETTKAVRLDFFGGALTKEGFRVDRPGPLARARVKPGDVIYRLNGRKPTKAALRRFTRQAPGRHMEATYDDDGRLRLRIWR